jgi:ribosome-associated protein
MDIRKLQRTIVDGLEDVKAQNIVVFNTEHLSALFERVIIASGTSNRQTKSLAASVRDAVKAAGLAPPRTEGEANGEWIIVDCGAAVVHVMQPSIRDYYHLEELWGEKPVHLKLGAGAAANSRTAGPDMPARPRAARNGASDRPAANARGGAEPARAGKTAARSAKTSTKTAIKTATKSPTRTSGAAAGSKTPGKPAARRATAPMKKAVTRTVGVKRATAPPAKSNTAKSTAPRKAAAKKAAPRKTPASR